MKRMTEHISLKNEDKTFKNSNELDIPLYSDERINQEINQREIQLKKEEANKKKKKAKELEKEQKKSLNSISSIDNLLLMTCYLLIILISMAITLGNIQYIIASILSIFGTIYIGRRLKITVNELLNLLLWNITKSIYDFIYYKVPYELLSNSDFTLFKTSIIFCIISVFIPSNNIFFCLVLITTLIMFIVCFANRQTEDLSKNAKLIAIFCLIGVIFKVVLNLLLHKILFIDFTNIVLINLFISINFYSKNIEITEPKTTDN